MIPIAWCRKISSQDFFSAIISFKKLSLKFQANTLEYVHSIRDHVFDIDNFLFLFFYFEPVVEHVVPLNLLYQANYCGTEEQSLFDFSIPNGKTFPKLYDKCDYVDFKYR